MQRYEYTVDADGWFPNKKVDLPRFELEIRGSSITIALDCSPQIVDGNCCADFKLALSPTEVLVLESLVRSHSGESLPLGAQKVEIAKASVAIQAIPPSGLKRNMISMNWCDRTTWWYSSKPVTAETPTTSDPERKVWNLAHQNIIDAYHGKITGENRIPECRVKVLLGVSELVEQDPHYGVGGDFVVDYVAGTVTLTQAAPLGQSPIVSYNYENGSTWVIQPDEGQLWKLKGAECQFSEDIEPNDSLVYEIWAWDPENPGTKIMVDAPDVYKTMYDFVNDANKAYPPYPAFAPANWRGNKKPIHVFGWDFQSTSDLPSSVGAELRVRLEHDTPFGGTFATGTFYFLREQES